MSENQNVLHNLIVTGFSDTSFDDAVSNAINGAWQNHHEEFERFVDFSTSEFVGTIDENLNLKYSVTVKIGAIHKDH